MKSLPECKEALEESVPSPYLGHPHVLSHPGARKMLGSAAIDGIVSSLLQCMEAKVHLPHLPHERADVGDVPARAELLDKGRTVLRRPVNRRSAACGALQP